MMSSNLALFALRKGHMHSSAGPSARLVNFAIPPDSIGPCQFWDLNEAAEMATRNVPDVLREISVILEQFGRLLAELFAAYSQADDEKKRSAQIVFKGLVRPAMASFLRALERELG
jgi:hypothetical protein